MLVRLGEQGDPERVAQILSLLVARHEMLRTGLVMTDDGLCQFVTRPGPVPLAHSDLSRLPIGVRQRELRQLAATDAATPFSLGSPPLWRARVVRLSPNDWRLVLVVHQAVCGPASATQLVAEITECAMAPVGEPRPGLPAGSRRYAEFAAAQRAAVADGSLGEELAYWRSQLADLPADLGLPTDRPRGAGQSRTSCDLEFALPEKTFRQLRNLSLRTGSELFSVLLTGLTVTLVSYTGRSDIVVGWPSGGRPSGCEPTLGPWENSLVLRIDGHGDPSFLGLLGRVDGTVSEASRHAALPFELLVDLLADRDPSRPPLYQVAFTTRSGSAASTFSNGIGQTDLDIEVEIRDTDSCRFRISYATALFDAATAARIATTYRNVLTAAAADPDLPSSRLAAIPEGDAESLAKWNRTGRDYPAATVHEAVLDQVTCWPDAAAVGHEGTWTSYQQLMSRSARFAGWLRSLGVSQGQIVGVCLPRGPDLLPAILGILATGAAFLPLEPRLDQVLVRQLLRSTDASVVVTTTTLAPWLPDLPAVTVRCVDTQRDAIAAFDPVLPETAVSPDALAIALPVQHRRADSGVTGAEPLAVCAGFSHRAVSSRLYWLQENLPLGPTDRVLHRAPCSFDTAVWELFWPLFAGAGLVLAASGRHHDLGYLADLIDRERITVAHFPPNLLEPFLEVPELLGLERVICSGDPLTTQLTSRCFERLPGVRLYQFSGTAQTTTSALWHRCVPGEGTVPAGKPAANTRVEVLDHQLRRVPIGAIGELFVGGGHIALGYLGQPELTAADFRDDPFGSPGDRMFRTRILARWRADGEIDVLGPETEERLVRGIRVLPSEVRAAIERHPNVHRAEVVFHGDRSAPPRLVAYVRWTGSTDSLSGTLHRYLRTRLPRVLLPAVYVGVREFPAGADGGLDLSALPVPSDQGNLDTEIRPVPASTGMERVLRGIWREVLDRADVGMNDDFFTLGGTSMRCVKLTNRIHETFGVEFPLRYCFELSTVADYALAVLDLRLAQSGYDIDEVVNTFRTWNIRS
jgi:amino acid adenylation domain-containing protein